MISNETIEEIETRVSMKFMGTQINEEPATVFSKEVLIKDVVTFILQQAQRAAQPQR